MTAYSWKHKNFLFEGNSLAGVRTAISMPQFSLAFDVANGPPHVVSMKNFFISHGHMDHAAGIPYIISQKALQNITNSRFFMPESLVQPIHEIMKLWGQIEGHEYKYQFVGLKHGEEVGLNDSFFVRATAATHRVPALCFTLFERKKKLKPEFCNKSKEQIVTLKKNKVVVENFEENPLVTYTGDTTIEVFKNNPSLFSAKILFVEVTYIDDKKSVEHARLWGHIHIDEILPMLAQAQCEKIVFIHISSRYSQREIVNIFNNKIPTELRDKVELFLGR